MTKEEIMEAIEEEKLGLERRKAEINSGDLLCYYQGGIDALRTCMLRILNIKEDK